MFPVSAPAPLPRRLFAAGVWVVAASEVARLGLFSVFRRARLVLCLGGTGAGCALSLGPDRGGAAPLAPFGKGGKHREEKEEEYRVDQHGDNTSGSIEPQDKSLRKRDVQDVEREQPEGHQKRGPLEGRSPLEILKQLHSSQIGRASC